VGPDGAELASAVLEGPGAPDLGAVDAVARWALLAGRLGRGITLAQVSPAMRELLELTGLRVEVEGQPELGEEPF
jgi:ADP-ribose pyrophosphatase YjhB (NUDIX family)